jgi:hypothetical protein
MAALPPDTTRAIDFVLPPDFRVEERLFGEGGECFVCPQHTNNQEKQNWWLRVNFTTSATKRCV